MCYTKEISPSKVLSNDSDNSINKKENSTYLTPQMIFFCTKLKHIFKQTNKQTKTVYLGKIPADKM